MIPVLAFWLYCGPYLFLMGGLVAQQEGMYPCNPQMLTTACAAPSR